MKIGRLAEFNGLAYRIITADAGTGTHIRKISACSGLAIGTGSPWLKTMRANGNGMSGSERIGIRFFCELIILHNLAHDKINDRDHQYRHKDAPADQHEPKTHLEKKDKSSGQQNAFEQNVFQSVSSAPCGSWGRENQASDRAIRIKAAAATQPMVQRRPRPSGIS